MIATHHDSPFVAGCLESLEAWLWGASDEELTTFHAFQEFLIRLVWSFRGKYRDYKTKLLLVGGWASPLKNMSSSIGMISNPIFLGNKIDGNHSPPTSKAPWSFMGFFIWIITLQSWIIWIFMVFIKQNYWSVIIHLKNPMKFSPSIIPAWCSYDVLLIANYEHNST